MEDLHGALLARPREGDGPPSAADPGLDALRGARRAVEVAFYAALDADARDLASSAYDRLEELRLDILRREQVLAGGAPGAHIERPRPQGRPRMAVCAADDQYFWVVWPADSGYGRAIEDVPIGAGYAPDRAQAREAARAAAREAVGTLKPVLLHTATARIGHRALQRAAIIYGQPLIGTYRPDVKYIREEQ